MPLDKKKKQTRWPTVLQESLRILALTQKDGRQMLRDKDGLTKLNQNGRHFLAFSLGMEREFSMLHRKDLIFVTSDSFLTQTKMKNKMATHGFREFWEIVDAKMFNLALIVVTFLCEVGRLPPPRRRRKAKGRESCFCDEKLIPKSLKLDKFNIFADYL